MLLMGSFFFYCSHPIHLKSFQINIIAFQLHLCKKKKKKKVGDVFICLQGQKKKKRKSTKKLHPTSISQMDRCPHYYENQFHLYKNCWIICEVAVNGRKMISRDAEVEMEINILQKAHDNFSDTWEILLSVCFNALNEYMVKLETLMGLFLKLTVTRAKFGQLIWWDGRCWGPILWWRTDLGQGFISFLHWTDLLQRFNSKMTKKKKVVNETIQFLLWRQRQKKNLVKQPTLLVHGVVLPVVWVGKLNWFGQIMKAIDARTGLAHGLAVKAAAIKVGQLLPVVLLILIWVIVVGTHYIIYGFSMRLLWLRGPEEKTKEKK